MKTVGVQGHEQIGDVFKKGDVIALIGPYGGGKSMILQKWGSDIVTKWTTTA